MPTIKRFTNSRIVIYPQEHGVPHFHVEFTDGDRCAISIATLEVLAGQVHPQRRLREALTWAEGNRTLLFMKWKEITR
jgi:hypothetical protein